MLDVRPENLWAEIKQAEEVRDDFLGNDYEDKISRYAGPGFRRQWKRSEVDLENHTYEWISLFLPQLASGNPRVKVKTPRRGHKAETLSRATQLAVNRNLVLTDFKRLTEKLAVDFAFRWCISLTTPEPVPGFADREDPPFRPASKRISPSRYITDPAALEHSEVRFQGHKLIRDVDDLLQEAEDYPARGWNRDLILALPKDRPHHELYRKRDITVQRREVEYYEVWVPEVTLEEATDDKGNKFKPTKEKGFHGTIFTIARQTIQSGEHKTSYLRDPRPFWGPQEGPYTFGGYLIVPDEVMPLSPIGAVEAQSEELNALRQAISAAIERHKRGIAVDAQTAELAEKMKEFEDLNVFMVDAVDELQKHVVQIELAGITPTHITQYQLLRESLDRAAGMSEAQRGQVTGAGTATEAAIASQSSGQRMGFMSEKFLGIVQKIIQKEAWYLIHDPRYRQHLGEDARGVFEDEMGEPVEEVVYVGSLNNSDLLEELDIQIEPISMRYTSEALEAERQAKVDNLVLTALPLLPQIAPFTDVDLWLQSKADEIGDPSIPKLVDVDRVRQIGEVLLGLQFMGGLNTTPPPQPRLANDTQPHLKASETPQGFSANARPQPQKGPRQPASGSQTSETHSNVNARSA
jgi:hypothetical protein